MTKKRIVLAYSGGLDASVAIGWIREKLDVEVIAISVDYNQGGEDLQVIRQHALDCDAVETYVADAKGEFANNYCMPALCTNGLYEGKCPLVSALSRPLISKHLVMAAKQSDATTMAHGCTDKGNDQVRFEVSFASLTPDLDYVSPVRDLSLQHDVSIAYAEEHRLPIETTRHNPFSADQNVWGRTVETGSLENLWNAPTKDAYNYIDDPAFAGIPDEVAIGFEKSIPVATDGVKMTPLQVIQEISRRARAQGIGRIDMVGDRLVGIRSREIYKAPGAIALTTARQALEGLTLERLQLRYKRQRAGPTWSGLVYEAQWNSPLKESSDVLVDFTQEYVTGKIRMMMHAGRIVVDGRRSKASLYDFKLATCDSGDTYNQAVARGFIGIYGMQSRLAVTRDVRFGKDIELTASHL